MESADVNAPTSHSRSKKNKENSINKLFASNAFISWSIDETHVSAFFSLVTAIFAYHDLLTNGSNPYKINSEKNIPFA